MSSDTSDRIQPEVVNIDPTLVQTLTVGEIEFLEEKTGRSVAKAFGGDAPMGTALRALAYLTKRRDDPDFTWEQSADLRVNLIRDEEEGSTLDEDALPPPSGRRSGTGSRTRKLRAAS